MRYRDKLDASHPRNVNEVFLQIFKQLLQSDADFSNIYTWTRCIAALALALALAIAIAIATLYLPVRKSSIQHTRTFVLLCFLNFRRLLFMTTSTNTNTNSTNAKPVTNPTPSAIPEDTAQSTDIGADTDTDTDNTLEEDTQTRSVFDPKMFEGYMRSASANRMCVFATLYRTTDDFEMFKEHAEKLALAYSTSTGIDTATMGLLALVGKIPLNGYNGSVYKARSNVAAKSSLKLDDEFAKTLIQFLNAFAVVSKYCVVS